VFLFEVQFPLKGQTILLATTDPNVISKQNSSRNKKEIVMVPNSRNRNLVRFVLSIEVILTLSFAVLMSGCKKNDNPISGEQPSQFFYGQVVDSQGNPLEGCGIHYLYTLTTSPLAKTGTTSSSGDIRFTLPTRSKVTIKILRWFTRDTILTLVDDSLDAGYHEITFDETKFTNGIYIYQITTDTLLVETRVNIIDNDISSLVNTTPLVITSSSGSFKLPYGIFGFGIPWDQSGDGPIDSVYASHTIQIVLYKSGYLTTTKTITIDETNSAVQTFTLTKQ